MDFTEKSAIERVEDHGLSIIQNRIGDGSEFGRVMYAVSIDDTGNEPTVEQIRQCKWHRSARLAAEAYVLENPDHF